MASTSLTNELSTSGEYSASFERPQCLEESERNSDIVQCGERERDIANFYKESNMSHNVNNN